MSGDHELEASLGFYYVHDLPGKYNKTLSEKQSNKLLPVISENSAPVNSLPGFPLSGCLNSTIPFLSLVTVNGHHWQTLHLSSDVLNV